MTAFLFEFKDQMLKLDSKPQPRIGSLYGTCGGCVFSYPSWCNADNIRQESGPDCLGDKLIFIAADKATEEKLTMLKVAERLKK